jgi:hypothetical protein
LVLATNEFDLAKPAEEKEEIVNAHALAVHETLGAADLASRREPSGLSRPRRRFKIGREVGRCVSAHPRSRQI